MIDFDNILYSPLDIPTLPLKNRDRIIELYKEHASNITKPTDPNLPVFWKGLTCYKGPTFTTEMLMHVGTFIDMSDLLKDDVDILNTYLPIEVESISLWSNVQYVPSHQDKLMYDTRLDFRFRFIIAQDTKSFFIDYGDKKRYINIPDTTNTFCFNNQPCSHGASFDPNNFKILGVIRGKINDEQKLSDLLESSIQKYSNTCYTKENFFGQPRG
jgi:hypothetical protein